MNMRMKNENGKLSEGCRVYMEKSEERWRQYPTYLWLPCSHGSPFFSYQAWTPPWIAAGSGMKLPLRRCPSALGLDYEPWGHKGFKDTLAGWIARPREGWRWMSGQGQGLTTSRSLKKMPISIQIMYDRILILTFESDRSCNVQKQSSPIEARTIIDILPDWCHNREHGQNSTNGEELGLKKKGKKAELLFIIVNLLSFFLHPSLLAA